MYHANYKCGAPTKYIRREQRQARARQCQCRRCPDCKLRQSCDERRAMVDAEIGRAVSSYGLGSTLGRPSCDTLYLIEDLDGAESHAD